jgi:hypothetical protein
VAESIRDTFMRRNATSAALQSEVMRIALDLALLTIPDSTPLAPNDARGDSLSGGASVDDQLGAGDKGRLVRGQV